MFFGNEKKNRKSRSEEKKVKGKIIYFCGLESGQAKREKIFLSCAQIISRRRGFRKFSTIFLQFFYNFSTIFWKISIIFWKIFPIFWKIFYNFSAIFRKIFRKFSPTIRCGSTKSRHYCKFIIKFTIKFTLILIKILQSTKFEGSHFHNSLKAFTITNKLSQLSKSFYNY